MKVLSVRQPWADLIMSGQKWCENRTFRTHHRGPLAIHASGKPDPSAPLGGQAGVILGTVEVVDCVPIDVLSAFEGRSLRSLKSGRLVILEPRRNEAVAAVRRIAEAVDIPLEDIDGHPSWEHIEGPVCWIVGRPVLFDEPIPAKGKLGLWTADIPSLAKA